MQVFGQKLGNEKGHAGAGLPGGHQLQARQTVSFGHIVRHRDQYPVGRGADDAARRLTEQHLTVGIVRGIESPTVNDDKAARHTGLGPHLKHFKHGYKITSENIAVSEWRERRRQR